MFTALIGVLLTAAQASTAPPPRDLSTSLQVGSYVYYPDGHAVATWRDARGRNPVSDDIFTVDTLCVFETRDDRRSTAAYGWHIDMRPIRQADNELVVQVDWRRVRDRSHDASGPHGSVQMTLRPGDRVPIDYIVPGPAQPGRSCSAIGMSLEVLLGPVRGAPVPDAAGPDRELAESDVWLVHRLPDGSERMDTLELRGPVHEPLTFVFKDTRIATPGGDAIVRIDGSLRTRPTRDGALALELAVGRSLSTPLSRRRWPYWDSGGGLSTVTAAGSDEVVSFELPPIQDPLPALKGHSFSIRILPRLLRLTPVSKQSGQEEVVLNFEIYKNGVLAAAPVVSTSMARKASLTVGSFALDVEPTRLDPQHISVQVTFRIAEVLRPVRFTLNGQVPSLNIVTVGNDVFEIRLALGGAK